MQTMSIGNQLQVIEHFTEGTMLAGEAKSNVWFARSNIVAEFKALTVGLCELF